MNSQTSIESLALGFATLLPGIAPGELGRPSAPRRADTNPATEVAWRDILRLWLTWNEVHEQVGARMFKIGENLHELEDLLDHADQLRFEAVRRSKSLLTGNPRQS